MSGPTLRSVGLECQGAPTSGASRRQSRSPRSNTLRSECSRFERGLGPRNLRGEVRKGGGSPPSESQELLHDQHIDPFPIEQALLPIDPHLREAHPLVEGHARLVARKTGEDELVEAELPAEAD